VIQAGEKLKPVEAELRRIEEVVAEIVSEMDYLRSREQKLRDTNESTNERVKYFAYITMCTLVALGVWQVVYLRAYFRYVCRHSMGVEPVTNYSLGPSISSKLLSSFTSYLYTFSGSHRAWRAAALQWHSAYLRRQEETACSSVIIKLGSNSAS
jgi:hypothetical protein